MNGFVERLSRILAVVTVAFALSALKTGNFVAESAWAKDDNIRPFAGTRIENLLSGSEPTKPAKQVKTWEKRTDKPSQPPKVTDEKKAASSVPDSVVETEDKADDKPRTEDKSSGSRASDTEEQKEPAKEDKKVKPEVPEDKSTEKQTAAGSKPEGVTPAEKSRAISDLIKEAKNMEEKGEYNNALTKYQAAVKRSKESQNLKEEAAALSAMAGVCRHLGKDQEALKHLRRSIELHKELKNAKARSFDHLLTARILMGESRWAQALEALEEALKIMPDSEAAQRPGVLEDMAVCQIRLNKQSEAVATYNRLIPLLKKGRKENESARIHLAIGEALLSQSDYKGARANFKKAESMYRQSGRKKELGETLFRLAYLDQETGDLKSARQAVEEGRTLLAGEAQTYVDALPLFVGGMEAYERGDLVLAVKNLATAMNLYERAGDRIMAARVNIALADVENGRSRFLAALELGGNALKEFRALSNLGGESAAVQVIGEAYFRQGYSHKALEYAQEALAIAKKIGHKNQMVESRILLAEIHSSMGDTDFAGKLLKEALQDVSAGANKRTAARVQLAEARFRLTRGASDGVLNAASAARKAFETIHDVRGIAACDLIRGQVSELRGEREKALELLNKSLQGCRAMGDRMGEGRVLTALGVHHKNLGDYDKSLGYFDEAMNLLQGIQDLKGYAANLVNVGNLLKHRNKIPEAFQHLEKAQKVYQDLSDKKGEADTLTNIGNVLASRGSQSEALNKFREALERHRAIQDMRGTATDLANIGRLHLERGELDDAAKALAEARRINSRISNPRGEVAILAEAAMLHRARKQLPQALGLLKEALKLAQEIGDSRAVSSVRLKMASVLQDAGNYDKALTLLVNTLEMMKAQGDRKGELWALGALGMIQAKRGEYESALSNLHKAVELRSELGLPPTLSKDLDYHLGEIYEGFKDYEQALDHYHKALAVAQISGTDSTLGQIYHRIGSIYYQIEDFPKARDHFEDALRVHSETKNTEMRKTELIQLGDILSKLGDSEEALKYQLKALSLTKDLRDERTEARVLTRVGTLKQMMGQPRAALENYQQAKEIRTRLGERRGINENLLQIALVSSTMGGFDTAVSELKQALTISQGSEDRGMLWKAYFIMGRSLQGKNRLGEALESYRKAMAILESMEADIVEESDEDNFIFGGRTALFETTLNVLMKLARKDPEGAYDSEALKIVEKLKAAAFENMLSRINVTSFSDLPPELLLKEKSLKFAVRKLNSQLTEELSKVNREHQEIQRLVEERRSKESAFKDLKARLVKEFPSYASLRYPSPLYVQQLQKQVVDRDEAILEYMVTRSRTYIFAVDKRNFHTYSIEYSHRDVERDVQALIKPLYRADTLANWDPSVAYRIYDRLIKPVEYFIQTKKSVTIIPHGPLNSLPFDILVSSESHSGRRFWSAQDRPTYLVEKYAFAYAPSASVLSHIRTRKRERTPGWTFVAFADAIYQDKENKMEINPGADKMLAALSQQTEGSRSTALRALPGTRKEISEITRTMTGPAQVYMGPQATETLFKKTDLARYCYVHLATHGVMLSGMGKLWQQPAVVFSLYGDRQNDGFLQLGEVFGLKLNSDLVALSSCLAPSGPASGGNSGLEGLARAFLFAGTDSLILSMWQVNDESTADLFIEMYRGLKEGSKADALRRAKLALIKKSGTSHPYYWGPFILVGNWQVSLDRNLNLVDPNDFRFKGLSTWRRFLSF